MAGKMTVSAQRTAAETTVPDGVAGADLQLSSVTKNFGAFTAVDDLDLLVEQGRFFALLGPSGCGKTTTLRMVAGLEEPTRGTITIAGRDITRLKPYKRPVNTVFQNYALFPHLDIFENVAFGLRRRGVKDVATQVGGMPELVEVVARDGDDVVVDVHGGRLAAPRSRARRTDGTVWLGVRPEKVFLSRAGSEGGDGSNRLSGGAVSDVSFIGVSTQYLVRMPWGQELTVFEQNSGARDAFRVGDPVDLRWTSAHTFLLDADQDAHAGDESYAALTGGARP